MRRILLVLSVVALVAAMVVAMAAPAFAQHGPPREPVDCTRLIGTPAFQLLRNHDLCLPE